MTIHLTIEIGWGIILDQNLLDKVGKVFVNIIFTN